MATLINNNFSNTESTFINGGTALTAWGTWDLASGDPEGVGKMIAGMALANLGALAHPEGVREEVIQHSAIYGAALPILRGGFNLCRGHINAGIIQMTFGIASLHFLTSLSSHAVSALSLASPFGYVAYKGAQDFAAGKIQSGFEKTTLALGGLAFSVAFFFQKQ